MSSARRVSLEPAFLLHHYPWRDTSRILELLTRTHGRVSVIARGSRQSAAASGGVLQSFTACLVSWSGRGEMGTLTGTNTDSRHIACYGIAIFICGCYPVIIINTTIPIYVKNRLIGFTAGVIVYCKKPGISVSCTKIYIWNKCEEKHNPS